jgi:hypothetical protein
MRKMADSGNTSCSVRSSACALARSRPKGFSTMTRAFSAHPDFARPLHHARRTCSAESPDSGSAGLAEPSASLQLLEGRGIRVIAVHIAQLMRQVSRSSPSSKSPLFFDAVAGALLELVQRPAAARHADDRNVEAVAMHHGVEGGEDFLVGQIAGGAEKNKGIGLRVVALASRLSSRRRRSISSIRSSASATPTKIQFRGRAAAAARVRARRRRRREKRHSVVSISTTT